MREEMRADESVFLMGEDVGVFQGAFKVTEGMLEEFGEKRVRDTPISENTIVGMGVGAAMAGLRPIVEIMTVNFALLAMDQIINSAAHIHYMFGGQAKVPLVVRFPQGGGHQLGPDALAHDGGDLPARARACWSRCRRRRPTRKGLLKAAIRDDNPVIYIEHESLYGMRGEVPDNGEPMRFGEAAIRREGNDVTIVGISRMAITAERAAETLAPQEDIEAEVIDPRTLRPLDLDTILESVRKTNRCVVVEEGWPHGGVGREHRRARAGAGLRRPRRAGPARHRRRRADAVLEGAGAGRDAARGARRESGARDLQGHLMAADVVMPRLSDSMEEGTVLRWLKSVGDEVKRGDELVEIETDKANMTYEATDEGTLVEIVADEGATLPIGETIARIGEPGEASGDRRQPPRRSAGGAGRAASRSRSPSRNGRADRRRRPPSVRRRSRPRQRPREGLPVARRMARDLNVQLESIQGSGPGGRIVKADVEAAAGGAPPAAPAAAPAAGARTRSAPPSPPPPRARCRSSSSPGCSRPSRGAWRSRRRRSRTSTSTWRST